MATLNSDLSLHNLTFEDAIELPWISRCGDYWYKRSYALTWCMPNNDDDDDPYSKAILNVLQELKPYTLPSSSVFRRPLVILGLKYSGLSRIVLCSMAFISSM